MDIKWQSFTLCLPPASQDMACSKIPHLWIFLSINLHFQGISHTFPRFLHDFPMISVKPPSFHGKFAMAPSLPWRAAVPSRPPSSWTRWRLPHHLLETKKWHIYVEICFKSMCTMLKKNIYRSLSLSIYLSAYLPIYLSSYLSIYLGKV